MRRDEYLQCLKRARRDALAELRSFEIRHTCHPDSLFRLYLSFRSSECSRILYGTLIICVDVILKVLQYCVEGCLNPGQF
jgi:hypothetical protein